MKNWLLLTVLLACLQACAMAPPGGDTGYAQRLPGDWVNRTQQPDAGTVTTHMHIGPDGRFSGSLQINEDTVWTFAGNWRLDGSEITWEYTDSSLVLLIEDRAETDRILRLDDAGLVLKSGRHGDVRVLTRTGSD